MERWILTVSPVLSSSQHLTSLLNVYAGAVGVHMLSYGCVPVVFRYEYELSETVSPLRKDDAAMRRRADLHA